MTKFAAEIHRPHSKVYMKRSVVRYIVGFMLCWCMSEGQAQVFEIPASDEGGGTESFSWGAESRRRAYSSEAVTVHDWPRFAVNTIASVGVAYVGKTLLKAVVREERPDHTDSRSFPSGHAAMAFSAARSIDKKFRKESIWIPIAGYAAATAVGIERVASKRHHWYDVMAGAAVGFGSAELTWWLSDRLLGKGSNISVGAGGNRVDVVYRF